MLRLPSLSSATIRAVARAQRPLSQRRAQSNIKFSTKRKEKDDTSNNDSGPPVFPGSLSKAAAPAFSSPPKFTTPVTPSTGTAPTQVPLTPPSPPKIQTSPPQNGAPSAPPRSTAPPPPPSKPIVTFPSRKNGTRSLPLPPKPAAAKSAKKSHKFRNFLVGLTLITGGSFAAGVFYSLKSDNVHDFFTEYIPFGEEAVLYFEEREFRRRFPNALSRIQRKVDSPKVMIPKSSGATWKISEQERGGVRSTDIGGPGPHLSSTGQAVKIPAGKSGQEAKVIDVRSAPSSKGVKKTESAAAQKATGTVVPALATVELTNANDPVVQDLVNVVNNIIQAINKTGSGEAFSTVIDSAKTELSNLNDQIGALKSGMDKAVEHKMGEKDLEFAKAAQGLVTKVNNQIEDMEHSLRDQFEAEREKMAFAYQRKLQTELQRSHEVSEQRLRNELLEQAIEMKRSWINEIETRVENERGGRLGKLKELEDAVMELERLTVQWNEVIDTNLKTQQTFTALEAVKASYESSDQPKPFLREMAALKEVTEGDEVIRAAIKSINPAAYQHGVSTQAQLVERFRKLSGEVRRAALLPEGAGIAAHAGNWALSKLMFKKSGLAQGNDVESILAKTEAYLEEGDVDNAAREMNQLSGWARKLAKDWLREAKLLLEVQQAVDVIAAEVRVQSLRVQGK